MVNKTASTGDSGLGDGHLGAVPLGNASQGLVGTATGTQYPVREKPTDTVVTGSGVYTGATIRHRLANSPLAGSGQLNVSTVRIRYVAPSLTGNGVIMSYPVRDRVTASALAAAGTLVADFGFADWRIDSTSVQELVEETRDWQELELTWRASVEDTKNILRALDANSGSVDVIVQSDGSFLAFDRSGGSNTFALEPPTTRQPLRLTDDFYVDKYDEKLVGTKADTFEVTVKFINDASRETTSTLNETRDPGQWLFEFDSSTISTSRVSADVSTKSKSGSAERTLNLVLTAAQAKVLEESASYLESVTVHEVPDGQNFAVDESPNKRNTVEITVPPGYALDLTGGRVETPAFNFSDGDEFAVGAWMTLEENEAGVMLAQRDNATSTGWDVVLESDGTLTQTTADSGASSTVSPSDVVADDEAHLVLFQYDERSFADVQQVFIDETEIVGGGSNFGDIFSGAISFGDYRGGGNALATTVDKMFVLDELTTASERARLAAGKRVKDKELMWLPTDENTGSTLNDDAGTNDSSVLSSYSWVKSPAVPYARDILESGTYAVLGWETNWLNRDFFEVELEVSST